MKPPLFIVILLITLCCKSCRNAITPEDIKKDSSAIVPQQESKAINKLTHLEDTTTLKGNFILFLLPDSARFASLEDEPGIYDGDADFGVGISNTMDSISKNEKYKNIKVYASDKRYIHILDCDKCPMQIDRDTISYGIIWSAYGKKIKTEYNSVHSGDYLQSVQEYFDLQ